MSDLAVIYRYSAGGNRKRRPDFFSKELALDSFLRAHEAARADVEVVFLVDGAASEDVLSRMRAVGRVLHGRFGSARRSYLAQLEASRTVVGDTDLVWLAEDDYLYDTGALDVLVGAVEALPDADYFALTGPTPVERLECRRAQVEVAVPPLPQAVATIDGRRWRRISSTTSTFGVRPRALREDRLVLRAAPWSGAAWDRTTHLAVQGLRPYPWHAIHRDLVVASSPTRWVLPRSAWKLASRVAVNVLSYRRRDRRRVLMAPPEALVAHLELPFEEHEQQWLEAGRALAATRRG